MKTLYESILNNPEDDLMRVVELKSILRKHEWLLIKDAYWQNKTIHVVFDGQGYMDDLDEVAEELKCKNFSIYPGAIITSKKPLEGFSIDAQIGFEITAPELRNCKLEAKRDRITIINPKGNIKLTNCDFITRTLCFSDVNDIKLTGNNFDQIENLTLKHIGPKIEKIVLGWNLVTNDKGKWVTYPEPDGKPDPDMNPFKDLGLDKHFKHLTMLNIASEVTGDGKYISFLKQYKYGKHDWGIATQVELTSGWQCNVIRDVRGV